MLVLWLCSSVFFSFAKYRLVTFSFIAVTCVNFNPVNDNFFISGSIDGKVRIWEVVHCRVSDYIDIREIVTAVCFRPDGKVCFIIYLTIKHCGRKISFVLFLKFVFSFFQGTIVGTMAGNCRFYDIVGMYIFGSIDVWNIATSWCLWAPYDTHCAVIRNNVYRFC